MGVSKGLVELGYKNMTESFCERVPALVDRRNFTPNKKGPDVFHCMEPVAS